MHFTTIGLHLAAGEPEKAKAKIMVALQSSGGNLALTARRLGVSIRQLHRWVERLALQGSVENFRHQRRRAAER